MEKNPKLPMSKMVSVISAKWREFIELKEQNEASLNSNAAAEVTQDESEPADLNDDVNDEQEENGRGGGGGSARGTSRRTRKRPADFEQADVDPDDNDESYSNTRRSSRGGKKLAPIKFKFGASPATPTNGAESNGRVLKRLKIIVRIVHQQQLKKEEKEERSEMKVTRIQTIITIQTRNLKQCSKNNVE
jgi:hypothetical protein